MWTPQFRSKPLPVGRGLRALRKARSIAAELGSTLVVVAIDLALADTCAAYELSRRFQSQRRVGAAMTNAIHLREDDRIHDRLIGALEGLLTNIAKAYADDPEGAAARRVLEDLFPNGLAEHTTVSFVDEVVAGERIVKRMREELAADIALLQLRTLAARIEEHVVRFRANVDASAPTVLTPSDVKAATGKAHRAQLRVIATVVASHGGDSPTDQAVCARILGPILAEQEAVSEARRRNRPVLDVDPGTGVEVDRDALPPLDDAV